MTSKDAAKNTFHDYPALAAKMEYMANNAHGISMGVWDAFCTELNSVLDHLRASQAGWRPQDDLAARQAEIHKWCSDAFGADAASSIPQRGIRHVEEAIEAAQAAGCERAMVHKMVDYVFDRPPGNLFQELGGSGLTLLALAQACGMSADDAIRTEVARVKAKPLAHFAARNQAKNEAGFDTSAPTPPGGRT